MARSSQTAREHRGAKIALLAGETARPIDSVAATGVGTFTGLPVADETVTIDATVYTWKAVPSAAYEVDIGADADACVTNLVAAILATEVSEGTLFGTGTVAHPTVTAADGAGSTVDLTAKTIGTDGNSIATTETSTNFSFGGATLSGGAVREPDATEIAYDDDGQVRTYELTILGSVDSGAISYDAHLWGEDSADDLTANLGKWAPLGRGSDPGHVNDGTAVANEEFRTVFTHLGNSRFVYVRISNLTGTGASIDEVYLREVVERNV